MLRNGRERNPERLRQHAGWFLSIFQKNEDLSALAPGDRNGAHRLLAGGCGDLPWRLVSCPRNSRYIVAIKMGRRLGKRVGGSVYGRIGVWGTKTAFRHDYDDQEVSKKLTTLCKRRHANSPIRFPQPA